MGLVRVEVEVSAVKSRRAARRVRFLVDSGAKYSLLPEGAWRSLGLKSRRTLEFVLADGGVIRREVSECRFQYQGVDAVSPAILGEAKDEALLGAVTLESLRLSSIRSTVRSVPRG